MTILIIVVILILIFVGIYSESSSNKNNNESNQEKTEDVQKQSHQEVISRPEPSKKTNTRKELKDYVVVDLETTGLNPIRNEIIEIGAVKVRNGIQEEVFSELIKPKDAISEKITELTGISNDMVIDSPSINKIFPAFLDFIGNDVIVGHNIDFDSSFLSIAAQRLKQPFDNKVVDTLELSREAFPRLYKHTLGALCEYLSINNNDAHRALSDALATKELMDKLSSEIDIIPKKQTTIELKKKYNTKPSEKTTAIQNLLDLVADITADSKITEEEVTALNAWLNENEQLCGTYPFDRIRSSIESALEDGVLEQSELDDMLLYFQNIATADYDSLIDTSEKIVVNGKNIVITGEFKRGSAEEINKELSELGAIMKKNVSSKVDYLIIGDCGSIEWAYGNFGSQFQKAMEIQDSGKNIKVISESLFFKLLSD